MALCDDATHFFATCKYGAALVAIHLRRRRTATRLSVCCVAFAQNERENEYTEISSSMHFRNGAKSAKCDYATPSRGSKVISNYLSN